MGVTSSHRVDFIQFAIRNEVYTYSDLIVVEDICCGDDLPGVRTPP